MGHYIPAIVPNGCYMAVHWGTMVVEWLVDLGCGLRIGDGLAVEKASVVPRACFEPSEGLKGITELLTLVAQRGTLVGGKLLWALRDDTFNNSTAGLDMSWIVVPWWPI